jgi:hypothetical protein
MPRSIRFAFASLAAVLGGLALHGPAPAQGASPYRVTEWRGGSTIRGRSPGCRTGGRW